MTNDKKAGGRSFDELPDMEPPRTKPTAAQKKKIDRFIDSLPPSHFGAASPFEKAEARANSPEETAKRAARPRSHNNDFER